MNDLLKLLTKNISDSDLLAAYKLSEISMAITRERVSRNMSQQEFAEFMGVSQGMVSKWENGDYNFTIEKLAEIASKLDMNLELNLISKQKPQSYTTDGKIIHISAAAGYRPFQNITLSSTNGFTSNESIEI